MFVITVLLFCLWLTELHSVLGKLAPKDLSKIIDRFWQPGYHSPYYSLEWWCKILFDSLLPLIGFNIAASYSKNKKVAIVFRWLGVYYGIDLFLFFWNARSLPWNYYGLLFVTSVIMFLLTVKRKQKSAIVIDFEKEDR